MTHTPISQALKGFLIIMIKETMYQAGYNSQQVMQHLAEKEAELDNLGSEDVSLELLQQMTDDAFHSC